jgi:hypothetical protein
MEFEVHQEFDAKTKRQVINGSPAVYHCHHYSTLFTQLALDAKALGGEKLLADAAAEFAFAELTAYFGDQGITSTADRVSAVEAHFGFVGLGALRLKFDGTSGTAEMPHSHIDEGWLKKWRKHDRPVNLIGQGYLRGACAAVSDKHIEAFEVKETQSIVMGEALSAFSILAKGGAP